MSLLYLYGNFYYAIYYSDKDMRPSDEDKESYIIDWSRKCSLLANRNGVADKECSVLDGRLRDFESRYHLDYLLTVRKEAWMGLDKQDAPPPPPSADSGVVASFIKAVSPKKARPSAESEVIANRAVAGERAIEELKEILGSATLESSSSSDTFGWTTTGPECWTVDFTLELDLDRSGLSFRLDDDGKNALIFDFRRFRLLSDTMPDRSWSVSIGFTKPRLRNVLRAVLNGQEISEETGLETVLEVKSSTRSDTCDAYVRFGMAQTKREDMPDVTIRGFTSGEVRLILIPGLVVALIAEVRRRLVFDAPMSDVMRTASEQIQLMLEQGFELAGELARGNYEHRGFDLRLELGAPVLALIPRHEGKRTSDAILFEIGGASVCSAIKNKVQTLKGISEEEAFDTYDIVASGNSVWHVPTCDWRSPLEPHSSARRVWRKSGLKIHLRVCHLPRVTRLPNMIFLVDHSELELDIAEESVDIVLSVLQTTLKELQELEEPHRLAESHPVTPVTARCTPSPKTSIPGSEAQPTPWQISVWVSFYCPRATLKLSPASLRLTSTGQRITTMSHSDGSFHQIVGFGGPYATVEISEDTTRRFFSVGNPPELDPVHSGYHSSKLSRASLAEIERVVRQHLAETREGNCIIAFSGNTATECEVQIRRTGPVNMWLDWPVLHEVLRLAKSLSLLADLTWELNCLWRNSFGDLATEEMYSSAGLSNWTRYSIALDDVDCTIWVPIEDYLGALEKEDTPEWIPWGSTAPPAAIVKFNVGYTSQLSSSASQTFGNYETTTVVLTLSQCTVSCGIPKWGSEGMWKLRAGSSHEIIEPFHIQAFLNRTGDGPTARTEIKVGPLKVLLSTTDIVLLGAIGQIAAGVLPSALPEHEAERALDGATTGHTPAFGEEDEPLSRPMTVAFSSTHRHAATGLGENSSFTLRAETVQIEITESIRSDKTSRQPPKVMAKLALITVEDIRIRASSEVGGDSQSLDSMPDMLKEYSLEMSTGMELFNRPFGGYEPCLEPVQLHVTFRSTMDKVESWHLVTNCTWLNVLVTEGGLETGMMFYHGLVNRLQEFSATIDETYFHDLFSRSDGYPTPKCSTVPKIEVFPVKTLSVARTDRAGPVKSYRFSAGKVLLDSFTSTSAMLIDGSLPTSPSVAHGAGQSVTGLEPMMQTGAPVCMDWSSASIWQKMMLFKEWNLITSSPVEAGGSINVQSAPRAGSQAEPRYDFVRSSAGAEIGGNLDYSCVRRMVSSQQTVPLLWRTMQEDGYSHGPANTRGQLSRGRYLSLPTLRSPPPSPDSLSPAVGSAQPIPLGGDLKEALRNLSFGAGARAGPRLVNLTGLPVFVRTARDYADRGVLGISDSLSEWERVPNGCQEGFALPINEGDGKTMPIDLCLQIGCRTVFLEPLKRLNEAGSRVHRFRVPRGAFKVVKTLAITPKGFASKSGDENESRIFGRVRRDWFMVHVMIRVQMHPTLSVWDVWVSSLYSVVNDTSVPLVIVSPRRGHADVLGECDDTKDNDKARHEPTYREAARSKEPIQHPRGTQSCTKAELNTSHISKGPTHLVIPPGEACAIPVSWMLPQQFFVGESSHTSNQKQYLVPYVGLWEMCGRILESSQWSGPEGEDSWLKLLGCLRPLLPSVTSEALARYQSDQVKDYGNLPGSSLEFPILSDVPSKLSMTTTVVAVGNQARKARTSDLSFEIFIEWGIQIRNRLCQSVSIRLIPPSLEGEYSKEWVCPDLQPGENAKCPQVVNHMIVEAADFVSDCIEVAKTKVGDSVVVLRRRPDRSMAPMHIRLEVANFVDPSETFPLSFHGRVRLLSSARFITLYSAYWVVNRLDFPVYLWKVGFGDGVVANRSQVGRFWTHSRSDMSTSRDPRKTLRVRAACLPAVQSSSELSQPFRVDTAASGQVIIPRGERQPAHWLGVNISLSQPPFIRTRIIELVPRFVFVNLTGRQIWIQEESGHHSFCIQSSNRMAFHPQQVKGDEKVMVHVSCAEPTELAPSRIALGRSAMLSSLQRSSSRHSTSSSSSVTMGNWSHPFCISDLGTMQIRHNMLQVGTHDAAKTFAITEVHTSTPDNATIFIALRAPTAPDFKLQNKSVHLMWFRQAGLPELPWEELGPSSTVDFSWHDPGGRRMLQVHEKLLISSSGIVIIEVMVSGGSRILSISPQAETTDINGEASEDRARHRAVTVASAVTDAVARIAGNVKETAVTGGRLIRSTVVKQSRLTVPTLSSIKRSRRTSMRQSASRGSLRRTVHGYSLRSGQEISEMTLCYTSEHLVSPSAFAVPAQHLDEFEGSEYSSFSSSGDLAKRASVGALPSPPKIDPKLEGLFERLDLIERPAARELASVFGSKAAVEYCNSIQNDTDVFSVNHKDRGDAVSPAAFEWALAAHGLRSLRGVNLPIGLQKLLVEVVLMPDNPWDSVKEIRSLSVTLQPLVINVDQKSVVRLLRASAISDRPAVGGGSARATVVSSLAYRKLLDTPEFDATQRPPADSKVYIQTFTLNPIKVSFSLHTKRSGGRRRSKAKDDDVALVRIINAAFENVPKVSNSPIRFKAITSEHTFATPTEIASDVSNFYLREGMMQVLKIIGSIDVLGNPVTFLNRIGDRVVDLLRDSADASLGGDSHSLTTSLGRGVKSIGAGIVGGLFDSFSRTTAGLQAMIDAIIIYLQWFWIQEDDQSDEHGGCNDMTTYEDAVEASRLGTLAITGGIDGLITGVQLAAIMTYRGAVLGLRHPWCGNRHVVLLGILLGVVTGTLTIALSILSAVLLLLSSIFRGLRNSVSDRDIDWDGSEHHEQVRPALHTSGWRCLKPYDPDLALVSRILRTTNDDRDSWLSMSGDVVVYFMELQEKSTIRSFVCITKERISKISTRHGRTVEFQVPFSTITALRLAAPSSAPNARGVSFLLEISFRASPGQNRESGSGLKESALGGEAQQRTPISVKYEKQETRKDSLCSNDVEEVLQELQVMPSFASNHPRETISDEVYLAFISWEDASSIFDKLAEAIRAYHTQLTG
ncbi:hypothetical protein FOL47_001271 [Perkinsus chesapeaki]|uniref:Vacuolar protein sorting-associated protein 13 VPS13 adaptor binding domain-containing protein n=1 Tax=Perkinsus chesapeaki TaxID=330153 RepID=A0A7J6N148_PERCH|nr:hypothetical protein FOL47_001271 [Perkinsus chesapeaki]